MPKDAAIPQVRSLQPKAYVPCQDEVYVLIEKARRLVALIFRAFFVVTRL